MLLRIFEDVDLARRTVLRRRPPGEVALGEAARARIREVFGAELGPEQVVREIIRAVRSDGDSALRRFGRAFDGQDLDRLDVPRDAIERVWHETPEALCAAMEQAVARIRRFHERAMPQSWPMRILISATRAAPTFAA